VRDLIRLYHVQQHASFPYFWNRRFLIWGEGLLRLQPFPSPPFQN